MAPLFARSRPSESGSPMSQLVLRCYDFPLRIPGRSFVLLPGPTRSSLLRVSHLALPEGRRSLPGPGHCSPGDPNHPVCSHVDVNGISQVPRRSLPCLASLFDPGRTDNPSPLTVSSMLPLRFPRQRLQRLMNFGAQSRGFNTRCLRFTSDVATTHARLASGWLARLYRESVELSGPLQKVSDYLILLFWI